MSVLAVAGMLIAVTDKDERRQLWRTLTIFTLVLAAWLGVVYGSWMIVDNPDPKVISLGNSHVRYWLPLFALASVFGGRALLFIWGDRSRLRCAAAIAIVLLTALLSLDLVMYGQDGFLRSRMAIRTFEDKRFRILWQTEEEAIVVVDRADKYLFPKRRVVVPLRSETTYQALPAMLELVPVYYFGITLPPTDVEYLNTEKLKPLGVQIELVETVDEESLYEFLRI